jgi:hypothetical protein
MAKRSNDNQPGPGRQTQESAFSDLTKDIAARNAKAHDAARKVRDAERDKQAARKRRRDQTN